MLSVSLQQSLLDVLRTFDGRTDCVQAELLVRLGALWIVNARYNAGDLEDWLCDLPGLDVAFVAFGYRNEAVGVLDPGPSEDVGIRTVAHHLVTLEVRGQ